MVGLLTRRAVVIGAGFAGLAAAAVLAGSFGTVFLIDQDEPLDRPHLRKSVPQAAHVHVLLQSGRDALSRLFPGFEEAALVAGSLKLGVRSQWRTFSARRWMDPVDTGFNVLSQTRPLLDHLIREWVVAYAAIRPIHAKVRSLEVDALSGLVSGVWISNGTAEEVLAADLVVDASGRAGQADRWLAAIGCPAPVTETSFPDVRYVSAQFTRSMTSGPDLAGWLNFATAPETNGAVLAPVEDGRWIVTATTRFGDTVQSDEAAFRGFLNALADHQIGRLLARESLLSGFKSYRIAAVRFKRFDLMSGNLPAGYLPIGDAIASFNPLFGQGMSVAALQAEALQRSLATTSLSENWQRRLTEPYLTAATIPARWAWLLGQATDLNYPQFRGDISPEAVELNRALRRAFAVSLGRPGVMRSIDRVLHLLAPPDSLNEIPAVSMTLDERNFSIRDFGYPERVSQ